MHPLGLAIVLHLACSLSSAAHVVVLQPAETSNLVTLAGKETRRYLDQVYSALPPLSFIQGLEELERVVGSEEEVVLVSVMNEQVAGFVPSSACVTAHLAQFAR